MLHIKSLKVSVEGKEILKGIDLEVGAGELQVLMGSSQVTVHSSQFSFDGQDISKLSPDKRAKLGIFLAFQHPVEIPGVSMFGMLRKAKQAAISEKKPERKSASLFRNSEAKTNKSVIPLYNRITKGDGFDARGFRAEVLDYLADLKLSGDFLKRALNEGFSGGEKKRSEILQMLALKPKLVILDEIDSGLDVDALKLVASAIKQFTVHSSQSSVLLITHYARILKYLKPDFVHIMMDGRIIKSGKLELARLVEEKGYGLFGSSRLRSNNNILRSSVARGEVT
ncbi:ATP-binding cassette domain-containing protein [Candidatus Curtissbacteria bacterium]|nr:ATP-binding cassette domain-containing protein [Candidatus Curtissbacteria bacterium]